MKQRALAGAGRADDRDLLARTHRQRNVIDRLCVRTGRIGEADAIETDVAAGRLRQRARRCGAMISDLTRKISNSRSDAPDAAENLAPDFAELAEAVAARPCRG